MRNTMSLIPRRIVTCGTPEVTLIHGDCETFMIPARRRRFESKDLIQVSNLALYLLYRVIQSSLKVNDEELSQKQSNIAISVRNHSSLLKTEYCAKLMWS